MRTCTVLFKVDLIQLFIGMNQKFYFSETLFLIIKIKRADLFMGKIALKSNEKIIHLSSFIDLE